MNLIIESDNNGRTKYAVMGEPEFIIPLQIAPSSLESFLKVGKWLIVNMSVWSINDFNAGKLAIELVKRKSSLIHLGLRPFDYPEEFATWLPVLEDENKLGQLEVKIAKDGCESSISIQTVTNSSPVWVAMSNGKIVDIQYGQLSSLEIEQIISQLLVT